MRTGFYIQAWTRPPSAMLWQLILHGAPDSLKVAGMLPKKRDATFLDYAGVTQPALHDGLHDKKGGGFLA